RGGREQLVDVVVVTGTTSTHSLAATTLATERVGRDRLDVALARQDDDDLLVVDEIEHVDLAHVGRELRAALVGVLALELEQLILDDLVELGLALEDRL